MRAAGESQPNSYTVRAYSALQDQGRFVVIGGRDNWVSPVFAQGTKELFLPRIYAETILTRLRPVRLALERARDVRLADIRLKQVSAAPGFACEALVHQHFQEGLVANALSVRDLAGLREVGFRQADCDLDAALLIQQRNQARSPGLGPF
jgi:hypothetical protein